MASKLKTGKNWSLEITTKYLKKTKSSLLTKFLPIFNESIKSEIEKSDDIQNKKGYLEVVSIME